MFRLTFALVLTLCSLCIPVRSQACGYSYAKFFVTDADGSAIRNVRFEFLEKASNEIAIHSPKALQWTEEERNYLLSEGMCGGHRDVRVKINAAGFEPIESVIDLPLNNIRSPLIYRIRLKKNNSEHMPAFEYISQLKGTIYDANGSVVGKAKITGINSTGRKFETFSSGSGEYELVLPYNRRRAGSRTRL